MVDNVSTDEPSIVCALGTLIIPAGVGEVYNRSTGEAVSLLPFPLYQCTQGHECYAPEGVGQIILDFRRELCRVGLASLNDVFAQLCCGQDEKSSGEVRDRLTCFPCRNRSIGFLNHFNSPLAPKPASKRLDDAASVVTGIRNASEDQAAKRRKPTAFELWTNELTRLARAERSLEGRRARNAREERGPLGGNPATGFLYRPGHGPLTVHAAKPRT